MTNPKEDIQFLKDLQHELKTQDNDGQAALRFWTVGDYKKVPCREGDEDEMHVTLPERDYHDDLDQQYVMLNQLLNAIQTIQSNRPSLHLGEPDAHLLKLLQKGRHSMPTNETSNANIDNVTPVTIVPKTFTEDDSQTVKRPITFREADFGVGYSSHGYLSPFEEIAEAELDRDNEPFIDYDPANIAEFGKRRAIWVCKKPMDAFRYCIDADDWDLSKADIIAKYPDWQSDVQLISTDGFMIVEHTEDGDNGVLLIEKD